MIQPRDVLAIPDPLVRPRGRRKWQICVAPAQGYFLRINSQPLWPPHFKLEMSKNSFLQHDSYVELRQLVHFSPDEIAAALRDQRNMIGQISEDVAVELATAAKTADTLTEDQKDLIWEMLTS